MYPRSLSAAVVECVFSEQRPSGTDAVNDRVYRDDRAKAAERRRPPSLFSKLFQN
jgi:hypothetical protein